METLIDREITHLARVMRPSLVGGPCGPILPVQYWRWRLDRLLDASSDSSPALRARQPVAATGYV